MNCLASGNRYLKPLQEETVNAHTRLIFPLGSLLLSNSHSPFQVDHLSLWRHRKGDSLRKMDMLTVRESNTIKHIMTQDLLLAQQLARHLLQLVMLGGRNEHMPVKPMNLEPDRMLHWAGNNREEEHTKEVSTSKHTRLVIRREDTNRARPLQHKLLESASSHHRLLEAISLQLQPIRYSRQG